MGRAARPPASGSGTAGGLRSPARALRPRPSLAAPTFPLARARRARRFSGNRGPGGAFGPRHDSAIRSPGARPTPRSRPSAHPGPAPGIPNWRHP
jgi:hypothetical protein